MMKKALGQRYKDEDWTGPFDAVLGAEGNSIVALDAIEKLYEKARRRLVIRIPAFRKPAQCEDIENDLVTALQELKIRKRIHGDIPSLDEIVDPVEERMEESQHAVTCDGDIVRQVELEMSTPEVEEVGSDSEDESDSGPQDPELSAQEIIALCTRLETECVRRGTASGLQLSRQLCQLRGELRREEQQGLKQSTIDRFFTSV